MTNYNKVEELLEEYALLDIEIKGLEYQIKIDGLKGMSYSDMPGSPLPSNKSSVESELNTINRLKNEKLYLEIKKEAIENMFRILNDLELNIIKLRYLNNLQFKEIAMKVDRTEQYLVGKRKSIINKKLIPYAIKHKLI